MALFTTKEITVLSRITKEAAEEVQRLEAERTEIRISGNEAHLEAVENALESARQTLNLYKKICSGAEVSVPKNQSGKIDFQSRFLARVGEFPEKMYLISNLPISDKMQNVSENSPLGKLVVGKGVGNHILKTNTRVEIINIFPPEKN